MKNLNTPLILVKHDNYSPLTLSVMPWSASTWDFLFNTGDIFLRLDITRAGVRHEI